jgi:phosphate transport system substrate-binding protein
MKKIKGVKALFVAVFLCAVAASGWAQESRQQTGQVILTAAGSGVNLAITRLLAEAFMQEHPQIIITVPGSIGTQGAIVATVDGAINLGLISRPLKDEEKALGLVAKPYARVATVIGAHPAVQDAGITSEDLIAILKGVKTRWLDGNEIIVQVREKFDSGMQILGKAIPGFNEAYWESLEAKRWSVSFTDQDANRALAATPYALGVTDFGMVATEKLQVKVLRFNGVLPSQESVANGTYPLVRQLAFIYRAGKLPEEAAAFLKFVASEAGSKILLAYNYVPMQ